MNRSFTLVAAVAAMLAAAGATGCGYTFDSQYPRNISSVAVPIWTRGRSEFRRDLELRLTEAIKKRIEAETPYKVVPQSRADTLLTGTLREVEQTVFSFNSETGKAREIQLRMVVDFTWKDLRSGKLLKVKENFPVVARYIPHEPFGEDFLLASQDACDRMAERVVDEMAAPW